MKKAVPPWAGRLIYTGVTRLALSASPAGRGCGLRLLLLLEFLSLVAELVGLAQKRLLLGWILLHQCLRAEEEILVGQRLEVIRLQREGLVGLREAGLDVLHLIDVPQLEVLVGFVPVVGGD